MVMEADGVQTLWASSGRSCGRPVAAAQSTHAHGAREAVMSDAWSRGLPGSLPFALGSTTRQYSAENPTGEKSGACRRDPDPADPDLMRSRPGNRRPSRTSGAPAASTRFSSPAACPSTGLLCCGSARTTSRCPPWRSRSGTSLPWATTPRRGCTCWWQMPFRSRAVVTLENRHEKDANVVAWRVLCRLGEVPPGAGTFHAQWRRRVPPARHPEHEILGGAWGFGGPDGVERWA